MDNGIAVIASLLSLYGLGAAYFLVVTNHAIDKVQEGCAGAEDVLPRESFKGVAKALLGKSVFLFAVFFIGPVLLSEFSRSGRLVWSEDTVYTILGSLVLGATVGLFLGLLTGLAAYVGAAQPYDWNKKLPMGVLLLLLCIPFLLLLA